MKIDIINARSGVSQDLFQALVKQVFAGEEKPGDYVNIIFMSRDDLRLMKSEYFGQDVFTDVIAFNLNDPEEPIEGEVYLSQEQITANAKEFKTDPQEELYRVLIHGCLHLCGYEDDTPTSKTEMTRLENQYLGKLKDLE